MTATLTAIDSTYSANDATGRKSMYFTVSLTNPYTASGESVTVSTYFKTKFLGGTLALVNPSVSVTNAGIARTCTFRGDPSTTTSAPTTTLMQFFNVSLGGSTAGMFVDNTVANLSATTLTVNLVGY